MQRPGILHRYAPKLVAFEHAPANATQTPPNSTPKNLLLWIGGLGDGLLTVEYPSRIAPQLPSSWSIVEVLISSSYEGWRTGNLARDAAEIHECIKYFRSQPEEKDRRIVLMGHSTGCQDIMEYLVGGGWEDRLASGGPIYGAILQGGVSDREAAAMESRDEAGQQKLQFVIDKAKRLIDLGKGNDIISEEGHPLAGPNDPGVSAYRTYSLLAPGGDDDYFSSDLNESVLEQNFGSLAIHAKATMFLLGERDQYVPEHIDRVTMIDRWATIIRKYGHVDTENGGVVPGATHNLNGDSEEVVEDLVGRVVRFLGYIDRVY